MIFYSFEFERGGGGIRIGIGIEGIDKRQNGGDVDCICTHIGRICALIVYSFMFLYIS